MPLLHGRARRSGLNTRTRLRPAALAAYIARSASRDQVGGPRHRVVVPAAAAMPMLALSRTARPPRSKGRSKAALAAAGEVLRAVGVAVAAEDDELVAAEPADRVLDRGCRR